MRARLSNSAARRLFLARHGLMMPPHGPATGDGLAQVIGELGFVQLDSVNTLARAHDLILWSRRQSYRPPALQALLHRDRAVFEHWTHDAAVIPIAFYPHWHHRFARDRTELARRWRAWQGAAFESRFDAVLARIADHGPCMSADLAEATAEGDVRGSTGWWDWHPSKAALEYLWRVGELAVARRDGFRKVYDLTERVIPDAHRTARPETAATVDWAARAALDRLGFATSGEVAAFFGLLSVAEAKQWCTAALARGEVEEIEVEGADGTLRRSLARPGLVDQAVPEPSDRVRVLSPFDPALRDRDRAERLFGFHYRIEIFVPEARRRWGYYVFPVLEGDRLIGRIDMKAMRDRGQLAVRAFWPEAGVAMGKGRQSRLMAELERLTTMADLGRIALAPDWLRAASLV